MEQQKEKSKGLLYLFIFLCPFLAIPYIYFKRDDLMPKTKKKLIIISAIWMVILLIPRSPRKSLPTQPAQQQTTQSASYSAPAQNLICSIPGLGDTFSQYKDSSQFTLTNDSSMIKTFNNGQIVATFVDNRAYNITIASTSDHKAHRFTKEMIPKDAIKGETETDESDAMVVYEHTYYTSEQIKKVFPRSEGKFQRIDAYDKKTGQYLHTVLAI